MTSFIIIFVIIVRMSVLHKEILAFQKALRIHLIWRSMLTYSQTSWGVIGLIQTKYFFVHRLSLFARDTMLDAFISLLYDLQGCQKTFLLVDRIFEHSQLSDKTHHAS